MIWNESHPNKVITYDESESTGMFYKEGSVWINPEEESETVEELRANGIEVDLLHYMDENGLLQEKKL
jgi:hypothetical protein